MNAEGFIDNDPVSDAYRKAEEFRVNQARQQQELQFANAANPLRLRTMTADTNVAEGTQGSRISEAKSRASLTGTEASVASETAPYKVEEARSGASLKTTEAGVASQTAPFKVQDAQLGVEQRQATVAKSHTDLHLEELNLIEAGRGDEAQYLASQRGEKIPDAIMQNAQLRAFHKQILEDAKNYAPNMPDLQDQYVQGKWKEIGAAQQAGQPLDPNTVHTPPAGLPRPPENSYRTGAGRASVYAQKLQVGEALYGKGSKAAADYAGGLRQMSPQEAAKASYAAARGILVGMGKAFTEQDVTAMAQRIEQQIRTDFGQAGQGGPIAPQAPAGPGAPAGPAAAPGAPSPSMGNDPLGLR